jgi:predicted RNase H-like nuclease (RuvC/YqgF family)
MATNLELQKIIRDKDKEIEDLQKQIESLKKEKQEAQDQIVENKTSLSGYVVTVKNKDYNGVTVAAGRPIQFRRGRAIILDGPESPAIISVLRNDFGYDVEHVKDLQEKPEAAEPMKKEFVEVLR